MSIAIETRGLTKRFGGLVALSDISMEVNSGEIVGIIGPNGAGKSTLVRAMLGLVPTAGAVTIDGRELASFSTRELAQTIAYLPQGQTLCTGHQPEKGGLGVSLHHLPGNTAFAGAGGVEHGGPVQGLQRLYSFLKSGFVDGIQGHRHGGSVLSELHV